MIILAFTFEADTHCTDCSIERFGPEVMWKSEEFADQDGNAPYPVFSTDYREDPETLGQFRCGTCGEITEY